MTNVQENPGAQRTRRNIMKMGAILGTAALGRVHSAAAHGLGSDGPTSSLRDVVGGIVEAVFGNYQGGAPARSHCFLNGTKIRTAAGERRIEDLAIGDLLPTLFGGLRPIQWIGRYPIKKSNPSKAWVRDALLVRIARSALAPNVPHADLYVTGGHSLFLDGLLVPAGNLINGTSIRRDQRDCDELEFFHIKLESHDVIYAEGAPVDTLLRVDELAVNFAEYFRKYGALETRETPCAPRVTYGGGRGEFKSRIRSATSPWLDRREPLDVIRDRLEERGIALSGQLEGVG
jgi:Hint domain